MGPWSCLPLGTIVDVKISRHCEERTHQDWFCDGIGKGFVDDGMEVDMEGTKPYLNREGII
jgi:hypothetical protein